MYDLIYMDELYWPYQSDWVGIISSVDENVRVRGVPFLANAAIFLASNREDLRNPLKNIGYFLWHSLCKAYWESSSVTKICQE